VKALSIKQPWVWLIVNGHKDVENRNWPTRFRGRLLVHAGKKVDRGALEDLRAGIYPVTGHPHRFDLPDAFEPGGIVGEAEIVDCVSASSSPCGFHGFVIACARRFAPAAGRSDSSNPRRAV
jgi:hypothetical protein